MAVQFKLTIARGQRAQDVSIAAGSGISGSDAIEINIDMTDMSKGDALLLLDQVKQKIHEQPWPQEAPQ